MKKTLIISSIVIVVAAAFVALFRYMNPGIYIPYKCDQGGDSTRKFYDTNWQARGAVCDGFWIPFGTKLNGKNKLDVLAKMAAITSTVPTTKAAMKTLAEQSAA